MKKVLLVFGVLAVVLFMMYNTRSSADLTIYSGRNKALVEPIIDRFEQETGLRVEVKYGGTTQLAVALIEEGSRTPADLFWAQDAGALGALTQAQLLRELPDDIINLLPPRYSSDAKVWVATSGRARVLAYSPARVNRDQLPGSVFNLTDPQWRNRIAWAPTNGSFQAFVSAMINEYGVDETRRWIEGVRNNGAKNYANNNAILQGIAAGESDLGITNHYYLYRSKAGDPNFPVENAFFATGDIGNMVNVAGVGITNNAQNIDAATRFIHFLLQPEIQEWFVTEVHEYPVIQLPETTRIMGDAYSLAPDVDLDAISNLEATLNLLREAGLL